MTPRRVMVVYAGWLGDLVWIVPTLHALKTAFESVSLVVSEVQAPLAGIMRNGLLDDVFVDISRQRMKTARAVRCTARERGIDTFIDLKGRGKTGIYMPWARGVKIWIPHPRDAREYALARMVHPLAGSLSPRAEGHMVDAYLSGLKRLGIDNVPVSFALPFDDETQVEADRIVRDYDLRSGRTVALHPGSAQASKIWPAANFRRLAEMLTRDMGCRVVLMGAKRFGPNNDYDRAMARDCFNDDLVVNLVDATSFAVDACLMHSGVCDVSVGNDSFANHMAGSASETERQATGAVQAANGRWYRANRTVSLFAPTNPVYCRPYDPTGTFNTLVMPDTYPDACVYDRESHTCPHYGDRYCVDRAHCMAHITVEQVAAAVEQALQAARESEGGQST